MNKQVAPSQEDLPSTRKEDLSPAEDTGIQRNAPALPHAVAGSGTPTDPRTLTPDNIIQLQGLIGNRAVMRLLQDDQPQSSQRTGDDTLPDMSIAATLDPQTGAIERRVLQRWDWGGAALGGLAGGLVGGVLGGPVGAVVGGIAGGILGGLTIKTTVDPKAAIKKAAESLVEIKGTAKQSDADAVIKEMVKIPLIALTALKKKKIKVVVCRNSVTEVKTELKGVKPRGWPPGSTWDSVPGLFDSANNQVIIATRKGRVPPTGDGHGAHNLVLHEVGHAIGDSVDTGGEDDPRFIAARNKDKAKLDSYEGQAGHAGVEETYAESFARFYGNDPNDAKAYPNLHAYWKSNPFVAEGD